MTDTQSDLSALAWVVGEVRRSLESAQKALRRYLKEAESGSDSDLSGVDPSVLRTVRTHIHQSVGALELIGLGVAAHPLRAAEAAVLRLSARPALITPQAVQTIENGLFALLDYLSRTLAGKAVTPLSMFPQYRALQELAGATRAHPADLWPNEWQWRALPTDPSAPALAADAASVGRFETEMLSIMRGRPGAAQRLGSHCAGLAAGAQGHLATLWQLAAAFMEALADGALSFDVHAKRAASRLLAQLRAGPRGQASDRLAQDLLFFCAQANAADERRPGPRLAAVRTAYGLEHEHGVDYESASLGLFDPALIALARKRVAAAKEIWSAVAGGDLARLPGLAEPFALVGDSLQRLYPGGGALARSLQAVAGQCQERAEEPAAALAMEVATALLYLDASLEDGEFDHPEMAGRVERLAQRIDLVRQDQDPGALERWMEDLYRRVSDRLTIGNVVQELRASLSEVEKQIDQYFRDPVQRELLIPVPAQLSAMRGVLSLLDIDHASQAVLRMRDDVDALASTEVDPERAIQAGTFDRLADNLGALSFLIDMVSVQPHMAKSLFHFDAETGQLRAAMTRAERRSGFGSLESTPTEKPSLVERAQSIALAAARPHADPQALGRELEALTQSARADDQTQLADAASRAVSALAQATDAEAVELASRELAQSIGELTAAPSAAAVAPAEPQRPVPPPGPPAAPGQTGLEDDAELREIFLEEAREVIASARHGLAELRERPDDLAAMTTVRRGFHTLKGSSRMVGLTDFGEAAWACEQLYNARLADSVEADADLRGFSNEVLDHFDAWVDAIESGAAHMFHPEPVIRSADAMRQRGHWLPLLGPAPVVTVFDEAVGEPEAAPELSLGDRVADLPSAADLELPSLAFPLLDGQAIEAIEPAQAAPELHESAPDAIPESAEPALTLPDVEFELDLPPAPTAAAPLHGEPIAIDLERLEPAAWDEPAVTEPSATDTERESAFDPEATQFELRLPDEPGAAAAPPLDEPLAPLDIVLDLDSGDLLDLPQLIETTAAPAPIAGPEAAAEPEPVAESLTGPEPLAEALPEPEIVIAPALDAMDEAQAPEPVADVGSGVDAAQWREGAAATAEVDDEPVKVIGDLRVGIPLFNIYLNEADELSRRLSTELAEWSLELYRTAGDGPVVQAHSLAGSSATVGFTALSQLARSLEHALLRSNTRKAGRADEAELFCRAADEIRRLLHQFAAGLLREPDPELLRQLGEIEHAAPEPEPEADAIGEEPTTSTFAAPELAQSADAGDTASADARDTAFAEPDLAHGVEPLAELHDALERPVAGESVQPGREPRPAQVEELFEHLGQPELRPFVPVAEEPPVPIQSRADVLGIDDVVDAVDTIDHELFPIFADEAAELIPQLHARLREWTRAPEQAAAASACMRTLHTFKGGARLAGAMRLGEMAHRLESAIEQVLALGHADVADVGRLAAYADLLEAHFDSLVGADASASVEATPAGAETVAAAAPAQPDMVPPAEAQTPQRADRVVAVDLGPPLQARPQPSIDWSTFGEAVAVDATGQPRAASALASSNAAVRVRAPLLDRLVGHAGEVSITRARIEADVDQMKGSLADLDENLERLRHQLRDIEMQAESQIGTRLEAARVAALDFDPLEMDRYTRFQEVTRMMAESVSDVATVQRGLRRTLQSTEDELARQARLTRDLQDDLLSTRMVEFESLSERLYRVVRQAAKETGKQVRLDITGGTIEIDRGVLDRVTGAFEHLLRNSVVHGIEPAEVRAAAGKEVAGSIVVAVTQEGNEVAIEFRDDGGGLALDRIRERAVALGMLAPDASTGDAELAALIFQSGVTTVDEVTGLAGRGVGMDVVRTDVNAMGGRIETATAAGQGTSIKLVLPLTTAVTQVVMMRCGDLIVAVPSTLVEIVRRVPAAELPALYEHGAYQHGEHELPFYWLASLLQGTPLGHVGGRTAPLVVIRSAAQRIAVHVDEVLGNQEVVVKNLGPQLARLPGLAGMTLLPSGAPALIYNPVALATLYGRSSRSATLAALAAEQQAARAAAAAPVVRLAPLVLVVDDSLTVRRVTQRLLVREGYRVALAKDGLEGLERLADELPALVLTDIEMPKMDGFDLVRNMRVDPRLAALPVIMITSRIAQKHRDYAAELGVDHYLGKPYVEQDLLDLVERYAAQAAARAAAPA